MLKLDHEAQYKIFKIRQYIQLSTLGLLIIGSIVAICYQQKLWQYSIAAIIIAGCLLKAEIIYHQHFIPNIEDY